MTGISLLCELGVVTFIFGRVAQAGAKYGGENSTPDGEGHQNTHNAGRHGDNDCENGYENTATQLLLQ